MAHGARNEGSHPLTSLRRLAGGSGVAPSDRDEQPRVPLRPGRCARVPRGSFRTSLPTSTNRATSRDCSSSSMPSTPTERRRIRSPVIGRTCCFTWRQQSNGWFGSGVTGSDLSCCLMAPSGGTPRSDSVQPDRALGVDLPAVHGLDGMPDLVHRSPLVRVVHRHAAPPWDCPWHRLPSSHGRSQDSRTGAPRG